MSNTNIQLAGAAGRGVSRQVGRALEQVDGGTVVAITRVQAVADVQAAQVDAVTAVAQRGLQATAFTSQLEQQLGQAVPLAVTRLQAVGDLATLAIGQVLTDTVTKLRRL